MSESTAQESRGWRALARRLVEPRPEGSRRIPLGPACGIRLESQPHLSVDLWLGLWESELVRHLRAILRPGMRCVDVGAFNCIYALMFAKHCRAPVVAYEPDEGALMRCRRNLALNPDLGSFVDLRAAGAGVAAAPGVVRLDDDLADQRVDFMLIDVDRAEVDVLVGSAGLLAGQHPRLIVETHSLELERACGDLLLAAGYRPCVVTQRRLLPQNRPIPHNRWLVA